MRVGTGISVISNTAFVAVPLILHTHPMQYPPEGHHLPPDPLSSLGSLHPHTPHDRTAARTPPTPGAPTPRKPKDLEPSRAVPWLPSRTSGGSVKRARPGAGGGRPRSPWQRSAARPGPHGSARPRSRPPARRAHARPSHGHAPPLTGLREGEGGRGGGRGKREINIKNTNAHMKFSHI